MNQTLDHKNNKQKVITEQNDLNYLQEYLQFDLAFDCVLYIVQVSISDDLMYMATIDHTNQLQLWDLQNNKVLRSYPVEKQDIQQMLFSFDSRLLIVILEIAYSNILIFQVDSNSTQPYARLKGHNSYVQCIALTQDSMYLLSGGNDNLFKLWDLVKFKNLWSYQVSNSILAIKISENQLQFSCVCSDGMGYLFKQKSKIIRNSYIIIKWKIYNSCKSTCISFTKDSLKLITFDQEKIKIWGIGTNMKQIRQIQMKYDKYEIYDSETLIILNQKFISCYFNEQFEFYDFERGRKFRIDKSLGVNLFAISKDANCIISRTIYDQFMIYWRK